MAERVESKDEAVGTDQEYVGPDPSMKAGRQQSQPKHILAIFQTKKKKTSKRKEFVIPALIQQPT